MTYSKQGRRISTPLKNGRNLQTAQQQISSVLCMVTRVDKYFSKSIYGVLSMLSSMILIMYFISPVVLDPDDEDDLVGHLTITITALHALTTLSHQQ